MILLDTQAVIWLMTDKRQLSTAAAACIREASAAAGGVAIASSTLWEIAMTYSKGGIGLTVPPAEFLRGIERTFVVLPITGLIAERSLKFSQAYPKDPTDRLIGATALIHEARLVTKDKAIRASGEVNCVW